MNRAGSFLDALFWTDILPEDEMPNRILREGILSSDRVDRLDWPAECFYRRLMSVVDDFGRFDGRVQIILAACYPLKLGHVREADIQRWIAACVKAGLVRLYSANGKQFLYLIDFNQQIRAVKSKYPDPCNTDAQQMRSTCVASAHLDVVVGEVVSEGVESAAAQVPHADFQKAWNSLGAPFAELATWNDKRKGWLKARWADEFFRLHWITALQRVKTSDFCRGSNDRGWIADVDFFLRPDTVPKIIEGKYDNRGGAKQQIQAAKTADVEDRYAKIRAKQLLRDLGEIPIPRDADGRVRS